MSGSDRQRPEVADTDGQDEPLSSRMALAARDLETEVDPAHTYQKATELAVATIDRCDAASLTLVGVGGSRVRSLAATDPAAALADSLQEELGEGPCLDAIQRAADTHRAVLARDGRWASWGPRVVADTGLASVLSVRLFTHSDRLGALNLYSRDEEGFDADDEQHGVVLAAHLATAFAAAQRISHLGRALETRTITGQATGIVMERLDVDADVAFRILTGLASQQERKLRDVAVDIVDTGEVPRFDR